MAEEYLLFDLVVIAGPLLTARYRPTSFAGRWLPALAAAVLVGAPFVAWDVLVTGRHWSFNEAYYTVAVLGLPLGEWGFFLVVPLACTYSWEMLSGGVDPAPVRTATWPAMIAGIFGAAAAVAWARGLEYTAFAATALAAAIVLDLAGGGRVLRHRRLGVFAALVLVCTAVFNGYLTARPLVLYDPRYQLDIRLGTIPIEDFVYGLALVLGNVTLFERLRDRLSAPRTPLGHTVVRRFVHHRLGGYRHVHHGNATAPHALGRARRVAVVGGGLAGLRVATVLGARGFAVCLFEKAEHLGGKIGAWPHRLDDGTMAEISHGFHAFFRHYYNLRRFLDEIGASEHLRPIADYRILTRGGDAYGFGGLETTPLMNVLALLRTPMLRPRDLLRHPRSARLVALLTYDSERTFRRYDGMSFQTFADRADLPPALRIVFTSFARAFFATPDRMSAAEVLKSFHFFYLSHDHGLLYDHPGDGYDRTLLAPLRARLAAVGVVTKLGRTITTIGHGADGFSVDGDAYDYLVLAPDVVGAQAIARASPDLQRCAPATMAALAALTPGQRYAVLRLWLDRPAGAGQPGFVVLDKQHLLDSVTFYHQVEAASAAWAAATGGSVVELHCYAVPDDVPASAVAATMIAELELFFPALRGARILGRHLLLEANFTAFHTGMHARRPPAETDHPSLALAGDWVASATPAMLMEAAVTTGLEAANVILRRERLGEEAIHSVAPYGLLARRRRSAPGR